MNSLEVTFRARVVTVPDRRYRCLVTLMRSDRPKYWTFSCVNSDCKANIVDIQNLDVTGVDDFYDPQNLNNSGIGRHCKGTQPNGLACPYTYFFHVQ